MPTVHDVPPDMLIKKLSEHLRKMPQITPPPWTPYVKTGSHAERPPQDKDWWYTRCASILRKVYIHDPIGLTDLRSMYGGGKRIGYGGVHHRKAGGSAVRKALLQLEAAGLVAKKQGQGRFVTSRGRSLLDRLSNEILKGLVESNPSLARYS
ncbi:MAG: 30S ribosomal protein S19e [Nitrososphaerales archaeon]